ncbi:MAG: hypothetical protein JKX78_06315 [Alteromonadaceae bacterium]|nr:hypothetical protein [Alteromonadaceae bacterium]
MKKIVVLGLCLSSMLFGCKTTPYKVNLNQEKIATNKTIDINSIIPQDEINVIVPISNGASAASAQFGLIGGLIGGAIDSSVNQSNAILYEKAINPVRDSLINYHFEKPFNDVLAKNIKSLPLFSESKFHSLKKDTEQKNLPSQEMKIYTNYTYTSDFKMLIVNSRVVIEDTRGEKPEILYQNYFTYNSKILPDSVPYKNQYDTKSTERKKKYFSLTKKQRKSNIEIAKLTKDLRKLRFKYRGIDRLQKYASQWSKNSGELTKKELNKAIVEINNMIKLDINNQETVDQYKTAGKFSYDGKKYDVAMLKKDDTNSRAIFQTTKGGGTGQLCSIDLSNLTEHNMYSCVK